MLVLGREREQAAIAGLVDEARLGRGGVLVVRGEPGVGKSVLLADAAGRAEAAEGVETRDGAASAAGVQVLRTQGIESEAPLAFAALQRLLRPVLHLADRLPDPQAHALRVALGEEAGSHGDRFLVFLGTLNLLAEAGGEQPVLAIVDDAHWLDEASAAALLFAARRLSQEPVALLFGARDGDVRTFESGDLPELRLTGLDRAGVSALLEQHAGVPVSPEVGAQLLASTRGNPLALVELPEVLSAEQLDGRAPLPMVMPVSEGVERVFLERARRLSSPAQRLLLVAAADDSTRVATVQEAARTLGVDDQALHEVERSGLVRLAGGALELRHPLVRSAVYNAATSVERREVHRALAAALDDDRDRQVWHRAAAATEPDEALVAELDAAADRAHRRGGHEAAAAAYERAAELSTDPGARAGRLFFAARCAWLTGQPTRARTLAEAARPLADDPGLRADIDLLRARVEWNTGSVQLGHRMVLQAAQAVSEADPVRARELAMFGAALAASGGDSGVGIDPLELAGRALDRSSGRQRAFADLVVGLDHCSHGRWAEAAAVLDPLFVDAEVADEDDQDLIPNLAIAALRVGNDEAAYTYHERILGRGRDTGAMVMVLYALTRLTLSDLATGRWSLAEARATEAASLGEETGQTVLAAAPRACLALLAAQRGSDDVEERLTQIEPMLSAEPTGTLDGVLRDLLRWTRGLTQRDRPAAAFHQLAQVSDDLVKRIAGLDRIEAALQADQREAARLWVEDLERFACGTERAWAAAAAAHGRALLARGDEAEEQFRRALELHDGSMRVFDRARTQLAYGEFLRRNRRRVDAREHLRAALATFEDLEAKPWAERASQELRASGETARKRDDGEAVTKLTPQERQVAGLVQEGMSNREVAAQLFLSPRTIDFHLRNIFAKTGVTSRVELARLDLD